MPDSNQHSGLVAIIQRGIDSDSGEFGKQADAEHALRELVEQLETSQAALRAFFAEFDSADEDVSFYSPTDVTERLMRDALNPASKSKYPAGRFDYGDSDPASEPRKVPMSKEGIPQRWMTGTSNQDTNLEKGTGR